MYFFFIGLHHDDVLQENDDVKEALRRLPAHKVDERTFRIIRAMQLSLQKIELPKEQWTKFEEVIFEYKIIIELIPFIKNFFLIKFLYL